MQIRYSRHILDRLRIRNIDYNLPRIILENSIEKYLDKVTGYYIALMKVSLYNKVREVIVVYSIESDFIYLLTIHPLKEGQKKSRIKNRYMEEIIMESFKVFYDEERDILYFGIEGEEEETIEIYPGVNIELDSSGRIIGIETFNASRLFKDVIKLMEKKLEGI